MSTEPGRTERRVSDDEAIRMYRLMVLARTLEDRLANACAAGKLAGLVHSCEGHEPLGAAVAVCLRPDDHLVPHYRSRPAQLGKGMTPRQVLSEVVGSVHANSKGRGGETHVFDRDKRIYGMTGVLGANIPIGAGVALSAKMRGTTEATVCTFGDGTANRGAFHEALNLAAIWALPVVFVCENNQFAELSMSKDFMRVADIADRAAGYGIPGYVADGNDPEALVATLDAALADAREGRPSLIEAKMVRRRGHYEGDKQQYRSKAELAAVKENDPVLQYRQRVIGERGVQEQDLRAIDDEAAAEVEDALAWALASPKPTAQDVLSGVYA